MLVEFVSVKLTLSAGLSRTPFFSLCLLVPVEAQAALISSDAPAAQQPPEETET